MVGAGRKKLTSGRQRIEPDPPRHAKGTEALDHAHERRLAARVREARPRLPQKAGRAGRRDHLALARVRGVVARVQQLHKGDDAVEDGAAVQIVDGVELLRRGFPGVLDEVGERVLGLEIREAGPRHAGVGDEHVDVADILAHGFGDRFELVFLGHVGAERDDAVPPLKMSVTAAKLNA